ncbi:MAG: hypothetical protein J4F98_09305 [Acidobacteria bacterium]|nr:hypothetical protein [Acidobacteriota bacterium]
MGRTKRPGLARCLLAGCFAALAAAPLAAQADRACDGEDHRALDFQLGDWRLVSDGEVVGRSRVEKLEDGCLIAEIWSFVDGRAGRTYSFLDRAAGVWRRFSVSNRGVVVKSAGTVEEGELLLRGEHVSAGGETSRWRERWVPEAGGRIRLSAGGSAARGRGDRGGDALFDGYYERVGLAVTEVPAPAAPVEAETVQDEPSSASDSPAVSPAEAEPVGAPVEPEPALAVAESEATAPSAGEVTPASARAADAETIERIAMASPMVLRLPMGSVETLPKGYAWITRDTAPYLCEGVTIERLEVGRRQRRGRVELEVELAVHGRQVSRAVDVSVDLRRSGQPSPEAVVASGSASGRVGRSIPAQIQYGSVAVVVRLSMDVEVFDSVVADPERPDLVITLAVGK